jgi:O-antigen ligase
VRLEAPAVAKATAGKLPFGVALTLLAALPSFFNLATDQVFEEEKSLLLRAGALIALPALITLWPSGHRRDLVNPIVVLFAGLLAALSLATVFAIVPHDALMGAHVRRHGLLMWAALAVLFAAMLPAVRSIAGRELAIRALVIGAVWPSIYLLLQRAGLDPVQWISPSEGFKPGGTFGNHVLLGGYLALVIPLTAYEAWRSHRWSIVLGLEVAAIAATASRGAVLALAAAIATASIILLWHFVSRRAATVVMAAGALAVSLIVAVPALRPGVVAEQLNPAVGSARVRILVWRDTIDIIRHSGARALFGHGPESVAAAFPTHYSPEIGYWEQIDAMPDRAHNETLDMLVWSGAIGAVLELLLFVAVFAGALRVNDVGLRCALAAAVVAHVIEIQFGIASVTTRLCFLSVAAIVLGVRTDATRTNAALTNVAENFSSPGWWLIVAAIAGAASPWLSIVPSLVSNPITSGGQEQFIAYLRNQSAAIPALYALLLVIALGLARSVAKGHGTNGGWRLVLLAAGVWAAVVLCIGPSRADALTAAGRSYEREQRWPEATVAYGAASRAEPRVAEYQSNAGRASVEWALRSDPAMRDRLLDQARAAFQQAVDLNRFDIEAQRRLAAYPRIRASLTQGAERDELLQSADRAYSAVSAMAPTSPAVWVEWAWVDVDRGRTGEARRKLDIALSFNRRHPAALSLRDHLK